MDLAFAISVLTLVLQEDASWLSSYLFTIGLMILEVA
jgi:hypothetical protein